MLNLNNSTLIVVDVQGKLAQLMHDKETMFANVKRMISGAQLLDLPIIWTEQVPDKLGSTTLEVADLLSQTTKPISKVSFSCCGCPPFIEQLNALNRQQILMVGLETHICVYQTAVDLIKQGYEVQIITDAVASRIASNKQIGLDRMQGAGAILSSTEMALFELMQRADTAHFKEIAKLVR